MDTNKRKENVEEHVLETITVNKEIGKIFYSLRDSNTFN